MMTQHNDDILLLKIAEAILASYDARPAPVPRPTTTFELPQVVAPPAYTNESTFTNSSFQNVSMWILGLQYKVDCV